MELNTGASYLGNEVTMKIKVRQDNLRPYCSWGFSPQLLRFYTRSRHVGFVVNKVVLG
jgi:hypothetical protein